MTTTIASKVPFADLCKVCETIGSPIKNEKKKKILAKFISTWRDFHAKVYKGLPTVSLNYELLS